MPASNYERSTRSDAPTSAGQSERNKSESATEVSSNKLSRVSSVPAAMRLN